jgi:hypothetical protein
MSIPNLDQLNLEQLRTRCAVEAGRRKSPLKGRDADMQVRYHKTIKEKLAHEIVVFKRIKFSRRNEQLSPA